MTVSETLGKILHHGFIPIMLADGLSVPRCLEQLAALDLQAVQISCRRPGLAEVIGEAKRLFPDIALGVGDLLEDGRLRDHLCSVSPPLPSLAEAVDAGADFLVGSLVFHEATYERYRASHVLIPAVTSPAVAAEAADCGAHLINLAQSFLGSPEHVRALDDATFRALPLYVTGNVRSETWPAYVAAGAMACGAGFDTILGPDYRPMQNVFDEEYVGPALRRFLFPIERARQNAWPQAPFASGDIAAVRRATGRCLSV